MIHLFETPGCDEYIGYFVVTVEDIPDNKRSEIQALAQRFDGSFGGSNRFYFLNYKDRDGFIVFGKIQGLI